MSHHPFFPDMSFTFSLLWTLLVALGFYTIYRLFIYPKFFSPLRDLPGPPSSSIILGDLLRLLRSERGKFVIPMTEKYGPVLKFRGAFGRICC